MRTEGKIKLLVCILFLVFSSMFMGMSIGCLYFIARGVVSKDGLINWMVVLFLFALLVVVAIIHLVNFVFRIIQNERK